MWRICFSSKTRKQLVKYFPMALEKENFTSFLRRISTSNFPFHCQILLCLREASGFKLHVSIVQGTEKPHPVPVRLCKRFHLQSEFKPWRYESRVPTRPFSYPEALPPHTQTQAQETHTRTYTHSTRFCCPSPCASGKVRFLLSRNL